MTDPNQPSQAIEGLADDELGTVDVSATPQELNDFRRQNTADVDRVKDLIDQVRADQAENNRPPRNSTRQR